MTLERVPGAGAGVRVLRARGELDLLALQALGAGLPDLVEGAHAVLLELGEVTFLDSSGVRLVDLLARTCAAAEVRLAVVAPPGSRARRVLDLVGVGAPLVCASREQALERLGGDPVDGLDRLRRTTAAVAVLVDGVGAEQWTLPTPCADWHVSRLVEHLVGLDLVFTALLAGERPPQRGGPVDSSTLAAAWHASSSALLEAFGAPGVLERSYAGPLGAATGAERLEIRLYDLLVHGWDLAVATGRPALLPEDAAEHALAFARTQVQDAARPGRFAPPVDVPDDAPALDRLVAFLGRDPQQAQL